MSVKQEKAEINCKEKLHKKTLICIADVANKGKTKTAENVINILRNIIGSTIVYNNKTNISFIFRIGNQNIGVDTKGDPKTNFPKRVDYLASNPTYPCDAIVCTSRSFGETLDAAKTTANNYSMLFLKTSTYQHDDLPSVETLFNDYKAEHIIDLLKKRRHI